MDQAQPKMPESFSVRKLDDGKFTLCESGPEGSYEYAYDTVDEVLAALKTDLTDSGKDETDESQSPNKDMAKKITSTEDKNG